MPAYTIYDNASGVIQGRVVAATDAEAEANLKANQSLIAGTFASSGFTVVNGAAVAGAPPAKPVTVAQLLARAQRAFKAALAKAQTFNVAATGQPAVPVLCDGARATRDDLAELAAFGKDDAAGTRTWLDNAGAATTLTGAQLVTLDALVRAWVSSTYTAHGALLAAITAAPPSVTTSAQVDAFAWPAA